MSPEIDRCLYRIGHTLYWDEEDKRVMIIGGSDLEKSKTGQIAIDCLEFKNDLKIT
jgi:hypothetical protein